MMAAVAVYMALFNREPQGRTRGDFLGGIFYVSNWYQIFVGQGYTSNEAFVPFRHLWSLGVEEQFYLIWPLVMLGILALGRHRLPRVALWLFGISAWISFMVGLLFANGDVATTCSPEAMNGYWKMFGRCISTNETLYLGSFSRAGGLMMGAAFAMVWRPMALMRGAARNKVAAARPAGTRSASSSSGYLMWKLTLSGDGRSTGIRFNPWLFRGGFFLTGLATLMVIAAVTHQRAMMGRLLGNPVFNWVGTRSYGMYLYHWPIYQIIRGHAGVGMTTTQWVFAMALTLPITEASYRYIEMPIRQGRLGEWLRGDRRPRTADGVQTTTAPRQAQHRQRCSGGIRRRQHRDGRQPLRRSDRVRQRGRPRRRFDGARRRSGRPGPDDARRSNSPPTIQPHRSLCKRRSHRRPFRRRPC